MSKSRNKHLQRGINNFKPMRKHILENASEEDMLRMLPAMSIPIIKGTTHKNPVNSPKTGGKNKKFYANKPFYSDLVGGNSSTLKILREGINILELDNNDDISNRAILPIKTADDASAIIFLENRLRDIRKRKEAQQIDRKNSAIEDGFLYLVTSPAYPGWTKVGQTSDYEARLQTYQTASPFADFQMIAKKYVSNRINAERKFLQLASSVFSVRGEWINAAGDDLKLNF